MFIDDVNMQELQDNVNDDPLYANIAMDKMEPRSPYDIPLEQLLERYNRLNEKDGAKFIEEFQNLKSDAKGLNYPTTVASSESLKGKNRYKNILPSDLSRVLLDGEGNMSYINACYINGFTKAKKFIATQGPLPSTVNDFWRMIVEQKVSCIVMLTKCVENGKKKCVKYWPSQGSPKQFGDVYVENINEIFTGCYKMFTITITKKDKQSMKVVLLQYLNWPDHGVPVTTTNLMRFHGIVKKHQSNAPIVVHCSAGAGRTGAFIALDFLLQESESLRSVDVYNCILKLREQRVDMVQTCDQYIMVHKLILENYLFGKTDMKSEKLNSFLARVSSDIGILQKQFNDLVRVGPGDQAKQGEVAKHPELNRKKEVIPFRRNNIVIDRKPTESETPCLNASKLESYDNASKLIAAQGPLKQTIGFFWRAILDNNINTIVMLTECKENKKEQCFPYWPSDNEKDLVIDEIAIHLKSTSTDNEIIKRELRVTKEDEEKVIIQYQYTGWASNKCPDDATAVLELIEKMQSSVRRDRNSAVLVHCSDGAGRTGSYCAIINLIERLKCESNIDVFRAVKDLRDCRPGMVQTLDQYKFCFDAVSAYLSSFNLYANFNVDNKPSTSTKEENLYANI
uniref:receptor-type tyrosine-protein phosphatase alpha-like n=1 Tax=Styela clava TaxID=7725 RepID=UPI00193970C6|nr:receptor-type tyrosine-protein phosphatase alpha-like [Styela clava]